MKLFLFVAFFLCLPASGQVSNDPFFVPGGGDANAKSAIDGLWILSELNQRRREIHYIDGKYFEAYIDGNGAIIRFMCGIFDLKGKTLRKRTMYATDTWKDYIDKPRTETIRFADGGTYRSGAARWFLQDTAGGEKTLQDVADFSNKESPLDGLWYRVTTKNQRDVKAYSRGRQVTVRLNVKSKAVEGMNSGLFTLGPDTILRDRITSATANWKGVIGGPFMSDVKFEGPHRFCMVWRGDLQCYVAIGRRR